MSRKAEKILVVDVETANDTTDPLVYDIGYAVTDRKGTIYETKHFIIYDVFVLEKELMKSCYYAEKIPKYEKLLEEGKAQLVNLSTAQKIIKETMKKYDIHTVGAYNCYFDKTALNKTLRYITKSKRRYFFPYGTNYVCIWHMACQVLYTKKHFLKWARENEFVSPSGNIQTSAEVGFRYLQKNTDFEEEHMGLQDVLIECQIMAKCFSTHQKMDKTINRVCWRIPQKIAV